MLTNYALPDNAFLIVASRWRICMPPLPTGTVTFLFTDIEGSTRLWEEQPERMRPALARHDALLRHAIEANNGVVFKTVGDAFCAAFATAPDALNAALQAQIQLNHGGHGEQGGKDGAGVTAPASDLQGGASAAPSVSASSASSVVPLNLRVRMALHTGSAELRDEDYFGPPLNRVARLLTAGHGGQTLISAAAQELTRDTLPPAAGLRDVGEHRLRDLGRPETVFQLSHPDLPATFPPLKSLDNPQLPNNLPQQITSFIGREKEMEAVKLLLGKTRLLTLTGSGGSGKTRLSLQVAADVLENYPDGAWFVELASLADPALVPQTLAQTLAVAEEPGKPLIQTLTAALKTRRLLLVLDNCEHLLDACARLIDTLLRACRSIQILASSREGLGIAGEQTYRIPSLSLPDARQTQTLQTVTQYEAARLFVERACATLPTFTVTNQNAPALASICCRLDGIPLAIELAAARVRSLSVEEINSKLDNRFRLLTGGSRTALPRQQTLRALIDWSYDLLTAQEKTLLRRLSVFAGGWTLAAAEQVGAGAGDGEAGDTAGSIEEWEMLDLLTGLADKSLVLAQTAGESTRYRLLETVRQYARDRLMESGESADVRTRHGACYLALAEESRQHLAGPEQAHWLNTLEAEHDNLRQALTFYAEAREEDAQAGEKGLRLAAALHRFWWTRGHLHEGRESLCAVLAHPDVQEPGPARAEALNAAGTLAYKQSDYAPARQQSEESLAIRRMLGDKRGIASCLNNLGNVARDQGDYAQARALHEASLSIRRELEDTAGIALSLNNLAALTSDQGDYEQSRVLHEESLSIRRELGDKHNIALTLNNLGILAQEQGDYARAQALQQESLAISQELQDRGGIAQCLESLGVIAQMQADNNLARALHEESLSIRREMGNKRDIAFSLHNLGILAQEDGECARSYALLTESLTYFRDTGDKNCLVYSFEALASLAVRETRRERGARLWGAASALRDTLGAPLPPVEREKLERETTAARQQMGEAAFARAWAEGRALTMEAAIACALEEKAQHQTS